MPFSVSMGACARSLTPLILVVALLCLGGRPNAQPSETTRLNEWFAARWQEQLNFSPMQKTSLGIKDDAYDEIDDLSERGEDEQIAWYRKAMARAEEGLQLRRADARSKDVLRHLDLSARTHRAQSAVSPPRVCLHADAGSSSGAAAVPHHHAQGRHPGRHDRLHREDRRHCPGDRPVAGARAGSGEGRRASAALRLRRRHRAVARTGDRNAVRRTGGRAGLGRREEQDRWAAEGRQD